MSLFLGAYSCQETQGVNLRKSVVFCENLRFVGVAKTQRAPNPPKFAQPRLSGVKGRAESAVVPNEGVQIWVGNLGGFMGKAGLSGKV